MKFLLSFVYAWRGIRMALSEQRNLRIQLLVGGAVMAVAGWIGVTAVEWYVLLMCITIVPSLEMINSALENLVDMVSPEKHPLAGKVKDMAAGAVLWCSALSLVIGLVIFLRHW